MNWEMGGEGLRHQGLVAYEEDCVLEVITREEPSFIF